MVDAAGTTSYSYNAGGTLATEGGLWTSDTVTYSYHPLVSGLLTNITVSQPSGTYSATYGFDAAKRLSSVTSTAGNFSYLYTNVSGLTAAGKLVAKLTLPNTAYITNAFDTEGRLLSTKLNNSANTLLNSHGYTYNGASQRTVMTRSDVSTVTYTYDPLGEVIKALGSGGLSTENYSYGYDAAWNLAKRTNGLSVFSPTVNNLNELVNDGYSCTYDSNGNLTGETSARQFTYDDENQLIRANYSGGYWQHDFLYDGRGRVRKITDYTWNGSSYVYSGETRYIYAGMRVLQERNSGNTPTVSYVRGTDLSGTFEGAGGIGGLLARSSSYSAGTWGAHHFYYADGNGNIANLTDNTQAVVATYRYDPFGNSRAATGTLSAANVYRFSSKQWVSDPALYYYGYRFYDPNLQRWLNRDPVKERGGINLYGFVGNSAIGSIDSVGRLSTTAVVVATTCAIGVVAAVVVKQAWCRSKIRGTLLAAEREADMVAGGDGTHRAAVGSNADALTHCIAACSLSRDPAPCGSSLDTLDRLQRRENPANADSRMDMLNNIVGNSLGPSGESKDCGKDCAAALNAGKLWTFDPLTGVRPIPPGHYYDW